MAAKEKGKIVSASPDSPTLEKLSTFSQQIRSALHCFSAVATRTNALWQSSLSVCNFEYRQVATRTNALWQSVPFRRSGCPPRVATRTNALWQSLKTPCFVNYLLVATRTNALWQRRLTCCGQTHRISSQPARMRCGKVCCRTARKRKFLSQPARMRCGKESPYLKALAFCMVATRTNALWQRATLRAASAAETSQPARMRCGKVIHMCYTIVTVRGRNPHECAVAKITVAKSLQLKKSRNPHECAVAKLIL